MGIISYALLLFAAYSIVLVVYRLWFSPIAHIPGPLLARATYWYEFYYDVILTGQYTFKVKQFHHRYGPIIRVNPHEVHIHDADFFDEIYSGPSKKKNKWKWATKSFTLDHSMITATDSEHHRKRRAPFNQYFSKSSIRNSQSSIKANLQKLLARFEDYKSSGKPLPLNAAMFAFSNDSVMSYAFGTSYNRIAAEGFDPNFQHDSVKAARKAHVLKHLPIIGTIIQLIPEDTLKKNVPEIAGFLQLQEDLKEQIRQTQQEIDQNPKPEQKTIFHQLLTNQSSPLINSFPYLWENGVTVVLGATQSTAVVLYIAVFHLLQNPRCLKRLRQELATCAPDGDPDLAGIENLPYLTGVVKEALRLSGTVTTRLQRIDPSAPTIYRDSSTGDGKVYTIPPGTPMSSTVYLIHHDPAYYSDPYQFKPERWLEENGNIPPPDRYFVPFLKGSMQCIGLTFAYAEIYLWVCCLFMPGGYGCNGADMKGDRGRLELFETTYRDIEVIGDGLGPVYRADSNGVRIMVK